MKMILILVVESLLIIGLTGCMSSNENIQASNTIKVIREPKYASTQETKTRRQIETGKIEVVEYNSSIISPEKEGYVEPKEQIHKKENGYEDRADDKVSSIKDKAENRANNKVDRTIDNALGRIFN
ncbi:MAG: hypothetical protein L3J43_05070 [Sulfurovum sp.]|nr:hypothetical protein [Sulfurovum sp.]